MTLASGTKLGPYEIQSPLGAGGMGEVCRARDTRLGRDVAIRVLPESFSSDLDRFQQEARVLSALNHPNLLAIPQFLARSCHWLRFSGCLTDRRLWLRFGPRGR